MKDDISVISLFSGSGGNATYIGIGDVRLLIDAGVSAKRLCAALDEIGVEPDSLDAILITHEHIDHVNGLNVFAKKHAVPVHMTALSAGNMKISPALEGVLVLHDEVFSLSLGDVTVSAFPVPHDSVCCVGYRIERAGDETNAVVIATDIGKITKPILDRFMGAEAVVIEANHDTAMLYDNPRYPLSLKDRIHSPLGHLSNDECGRFLRYLAENGTHHALLAHLSGENNTPEKALSCASDSGLHLMAAKPSERTVLL